MQYYKGPFSNDIFESGSFMTLNNGAHKSNNQNYERLQLKKEGFRALLLQQKSKFFICNSIWLFVCVS